VRICKKPYILGIVLILVLPLAFAQSFIIDFDKIDQTAQILEDDFSDIEAADNPNDVAMVIEGSNLNGIEAILIGYIKQRYPFFQEIAPVSDEEVNVDEIMNSNKIIILLGGPIQNKITDITQDRVTEKDHPSKGLFSIYEGSNNAGSDIFVLSDRRGYKNIPRLGPERSPLSRFMPPAAVIAAASFLSILLASLWSKISGPIRVVLARVIAGWRKKRAKVESEARSFNIGRYNMKYREILAILFGAVAYATGVTFAVTGLGIPLLQVLKINIIGALVFFIVREGGRIFMSHLMDLHTEYVIWFPGAIFALFTGYLGNTLNTPGFVVEHKDKEVKFNKYTFIKYLIIIGTFIVSLVFLITNIIKPSINIQLFGIIASTYAAIEILPFKPCPGKDVFKWKPVLAIITLIIVFPSYIFFNFIV